jgi:hypothetical protein
VIPKRALSKKRAGDLFGETWWREQDVALAARAAVAALRKGSVASAQVADAVRTVEAALATTVLHPSERRRFERIASAKGLEKTASGKAKVNAEAAECVKLIRLIEFVAAGYRDAEADGFCSLDACVAMVRNALVSRGELRAAAHVEAHASLVRDAIQALARPTAGKRSRSSSPTANMILLQLVKADGFSNIASLAGLKSTRSRRD